MAKVKILGVPKKMTNTSVGDYNRNRFRDNTSSEGTTSEDESINTSVKPVDEDIATIEAEKGELIVKPGLEGIWKIKGKKHSEGGTPLNPEPGSFIFSNDPKLSISKDEKKLFEFKGGGSVAKSKNTPAKILEKEIDMKEYNRYQAILKDPKADNISKATAQLMTEKYQKTIGQVAYLQESKKQGDIPQFAMGTAPLKSEDIEDDINEQKMYKKGGLTKMALGDKWCPCGKNPDGSCIENCPPEVYQSILNNKAKKVNTPPADYIHQYDDPSGKKLFGRFGSLNIPPSKKGSPDFNKAFAQAKRQGLKSFTWNNKPYNTNIAGKTTDTEDYVYTEQNSVEPIPSRGPNLPSLAKRQTPNTDGSSPNVPTSPNPTLPYDIKGYLTPAQKANLSYLGLQAMSVKKYVPMREQINLGRASLDKVNLQPFLNGIHNQQFMAYNSNNAVDPRNAKLMNSNIFGKGVDQEMQTRGQVDSSNVQIGNQENLTNLQQSNAEQQFNIPASGKYYDQTVIANQNFDDERRFAKNQVMSTTNKYQSDADELAWSLASVNKYGTRKVVDPKTGKVYNQPVPLYEQTRSGIKYNSDVASLNMASGIDRTNSTEEYLNTIKKLMDLGLDQKSAAYIVGNMMKSKQPIYGNNPNLPQ